MGFTNLFFLIGCVILILIVGVLQIILKKHDRAYDIIYKLLLLLYSYYIISTYDIRFCLCILGVTLFNYAIAYLYEKCGDVLITCGVLGDVLFLCYFKYTNFFGSSISTLLGKEWNTLHIFLPIGISFYIFSTIGYLLDVKYKKIECEKNLIDFALWVSFFPKLVCGPIVPARNLLPQIKEKKVISWKNVEVGVQIFLIGLFKKMVLADHMSEYIHELFKSPKAFSGMTMFMGITCYTAQLYLDFSGYSDMAIGCFKTFGYSIEKNFNLPFVASTISEYWNRWHISLSIWLKEYIHTSVGVSIKRKMADLPRKVRKKLKNIPSYIAVLVTFLVSGFWHGAGWNFILYGLSYGTILIVQSFTRKNKKLESSKGVVRVGLMLWNGILVCFINVLFRADGIKNANQVYRQIFTMADGIEYLNFWGLLGIGFIILEVVYFYLKDKKNKAISDITMIEHEYLVLNLSKFWNMVAFFCFVGLTIMLAYTGETYFIYANF